MLAHLLHKMPAAQAHSSENPGGGGPCSQTIQKSMPLRYRMLTLTTFVVLAGAESEPSSLPVERWCRLGLEPRMEDHLMPARFSC